MKEALNQLLKTRTEIKQLKSQYFKSFIFAKNFKQNEIFNFLKTNYFDDLTLTIDHFEIYWNINASLDSNDYENSDYIISLSVRDASNVDSFSCELKFDLLDENPAFILEHAHYHNYKILTDCEYSKLAIFESFILKLLNGDSNEI